MKTTIPLASARIWARKLAEVVRPACERVEIVGSVRREREQVGDLELLVEPTMKVQQADLFAGEKVADTQAVVDALREDDRSRTVVKGGSRYVQMRLGGRFGRDDRPTLDIFFCHPPASWGALLTIRTGPADLGRILVTRLRAKGWRNHQGAVWAPAHEFERGGYDPEDVVDLEDGTYVRCSTPTEEDYFEACGVQYVPPERRDELARELTAMEA